MTDITEATAPGEAVETTTLIDIAPAALETVLGILADEDDPDGLGLRIEITGTRGVDYIYDLAFDEVANAAPDDVICSIGTLRVVVPAGTVDRLRGSVLDVPRDPDQGGLVIRNPNRPDPLDGVELQLEGSIAEKVQQLLEHQINPSLAAHGGFATLVGIDDEQRVFLTLGGGCQGCAMSRMTITQGIDRTIRTAIPEVSEIVDATDHSAGDNPFF